MTETVFPKIAHRKDKIWELFSVGRLQANPAQKLVWEWDDDTDAWRVTMSRAPE